MSQDQRIDGGMVICPNCGSKLKVTDEEMKVLNDVNEIGRICNSCRKKFTIYYFNDIFCTYYKES